MSSSWARRLLSLATVVLCAFFASRLVAHDWRWAAAILGGLVVFSVPTLLARRRMRRVLLSGDVSTVLGTWEGSLSRVSHRETMGPIMVATAYAAYGFMEEARRSLSRAARGPAWEAAIEQRLFVEALLDLYEGERSRAIDKATEMERLPLPPTGFWMRRKIALLRRGFGALTRAFAHTSTDEDERLLKATGKSSPLVHWVMRYGRAVFLVDRGRTDEARALLASAPEWPEASAFRSFHAELATRIAA